jgi:hypothetical protein
LNIPLEGEDQFVSVTDLIAGEDQKIPFPVPNSHFKGVSGCPFIGKQLEIIIRLSCSKTFM